LAPHSGLSILAIIPQRAYFLLSLAKVCHDGISRR
jgi:hypothetical protein